MSYCGIPDREAPDVLLHLVEAIQYYGFRSVVGTMSAMTDMDGVELLTFFCRRMFSPVPEGDGDGSLCERSARALQDAVLELWEKEGLTLERWVKLGTTWWHGGG